MALSLPTSPYNPWHNQEAWDKRKVAWRNKKAASNKAYAAKRHFRKDILKRHQRVDEAVRTKTYSPARYYGTACTRRGDYKFLCEMPF